MDLYFGSDNNLPRHKEEKYSLKCVSCEVGDENMFKCLFKVTKGEHKILICKKMMDFLLILLVITYGE